MKITSHRDMKSYSKYNVCVLDSKQRACQDLIFGDLVLSHRKSINYQDLVIQQQLKVKANQVIVHEILLGMRFGVAFFLY